MRAHSKEKREGVYVRRASRSSGLFFDDFAENSAWIREEGWVQLPPLTDLKRITVFGETRVHPEVRGREIGFPELDIFVGNSHVATVALDTAQAWDVTAEVPAAVAAGGAEVRLRLRGVAFTNFLAWVARVGERWSWSESIQRFRRQNRNRQLRILRIEADGETVFDFASRHAPYSPAFARKHTPLGMNVVGFLSADLGIGESARCMVRAADAARIPAAAVPLKLPCKARLGDSSFAAFVQDSNPHPVNVFHLDAPASRDIDTHHGAAFREGKYNVGYWAWELPEFPDGWLPYFDYFDEIWCPSEFVRRALAAKSPLAVTAMPHAVEFARPQKSVAQLRSEFNLPPDKYLFLFLYDLNSYTERKNPRAVIEAFRRSGLVRSNAALVVKVHSVAGNEADLERLKSALQDLPGATLIAESLSRSRVYELESACDCFVSLHRSEGFGFAVAESMYLGKPVITTDWSATAEYVSPENGAPIRCRLVELQQNHGPYTRGQVWAEPDVDHAAEWMQRLVHDPALGARLGAAARATIEREFSPLAVGRRYRQRLEAIASW